jgi:hypothetical protein
MKLVIETIIQFSINFSVVHLYQTSNFALKTTLFYIFKKVEYTNFNIFLSYLVLIIFNKNIKILCELFELYLHEMK